MKNSKNKIIAFATLGLLTVVGTYNAVVINAESHLGSEVSSVKRLDEIYGVFTPGRTVAADQTWKKLSPEQTKLQNISEKVVEVASSKAPTTEQEAAVTEELSLSLVEVINQTKWQNGLPKDQFNGSLSTNNGVIESLAVSLPNGESVSVSFSEMSGNVFEYDLNGELYSGMMYQVDQNAYMVTLTNGPLEGTRLRFSSVDPVVEQQDNQVKLAENNVEIGSFGSAQPAPEMMLENDQQSAQEIQAFNFQNTHAL